MCLIVWTISLCYFPRTVSGGSVLFVCLLLVLFLVMISMHLINWGCKHALGCQYGFVSYGLGGGGVGGGG